MTTEEPNLKPVPPSKFALALRAESSAQISSCPGYLEIASALKLSRCNSCHHYFALPDEVFQDRLANGGHIYCPSCGNLIEVKPDARTSDDLAARIQQLNLERFRLRTQNDVLHRQLASITDAKLDAISNDELYRRIRFLSNNADSNNLGEKLICRFCESKSKSYASLRRHLRRYHTDEISKLPGEFFNR